MDAQRRAGEDRFIPYRSNRFFCLGNRWYFSTREGFNSGPYATRDRAEAGLQRYLRVARRLAPLRQEQQIH